MDDRAHAEILGAMSQFSSERAIRFKFEIERVIDTMLEFPEAYPTLKVVGVKTNLLVRRALIQGFAFGLIFTVLKDHEVVRILTCYHTRSNPEHWLES